jgi:hypothetical protein
VSLLSTLVEVLIPPTRQLPAIILPHEYLISRCSLPGRPSSSRFQLRTATWKAKTALQIDLEELLETSVQLELSSLSDILPCAQSVLVHG